MLSWHMKQRMVSSLKMQKMPKMVLMLEGGLSSVGLVITRTVP